MTLLSIHPICPLTKTLSIALTEIPTSWVSKVVSRMLFPRFIVDGFARIDSDRFCGKKTQKIHRSKMPKLENFKETIQDPELLPGFELSVVEIREHGSTQEHLVATMNEVLEILQKSSDCLTVKDLHTRFVDGFPINNQRFARFQDFMAGFDMFLLENAVKFLAQFGYIQLDQNMSKDGNIKRRMILGVQKKVQVALILDGDGFWMGPTRETNPNCAQQ